MNKYKVEITETNTYAIDVFAASEEGAKSATIEQWNAIAANGTHHYHQIGDTETEIGTVYDVTNTDDPFSATNDVRIIDLDEEGDMIGDAKYPKSLGL